jgi:ataxin-3
MYWEKQEAGSQLCAQHCLSVAILNSRIEADVLHRNNILQQHTYSEFDLADLAIKSVVQFLGPRIATYGNS